MEAAAADVDAPSAAAAAADAPASVAAVAALDLFEVLLASAIRSCERKIMCTTLHNMLLPCVCGTHKSKPTTAL